MFVPRHKRPLELPICEGSDLGFRDSNGDMKKMKNEDGGG